MQPKNKNANAKELRVKSGFIDERIDGTVRMYESLLNAVDQAGGGIGGFTWPYLKTMTVAELLTHLGCNNIEFIYMKKE
jgi:hypothetical protein